MREEGRRKGSLGVEKGKKRRGLSRQKRGGKWMVDVMKARKEESKEERRFMLLLIALCFINFHILHCLSIPPCPPPSPYPNPNSLLCLCPSVPINNAANFRHSPSGSSLPVRTTHSITALTPSLPPSLPPNPPNSMKVNAHATANNTALLSSGKRLKRKGQATMSKSEARCEVPREEGPEDSTNVARV